MKMTGTQVIDAPRSVVWKGLNDPKILKQCIPGCESVDAQSPTEMTAVAVIKLGPVKASFTGNVTLSDLNPPESYRISGQGQGGLAGFANGGATVKLTELSATQTQMDYDVDAQIGGKLAMLGSRLIDATAQSLAGQFFTKFGNLMKSDSASGVATTPKTKSKVTSKKPAKKKPAKKVVAKKAIKKVAAKKVAAKTVKKKSKK